IAVLILGLGAIGWITARIRATAFAGPGRKTRPNSLPNYHGWYVAIWAAGPALLLLAAWSFVQPSRSEEHTSELQSLMRISYDVFCLKHNTPSLHNIIKM